MDAREDRKTIAGMLQRAVAEARDHSGKDCPGPDLLAAYYERALSPAERQQWEAHFSTCGLCQAQLAALARSEPQPQPPSLWFWHWHWAWKWLPPAAVALTAIAIWIAVHPNAVRQLEKKPLQVATTAPVSPDHREELRRATQAEAPTSSAPESTSKAKPTPATVERQQGKAAKPERTHSEPSATPRSEEMAKTAMARTAPRIVVKKTDLPPSVADNAAPAGQAVAPAEDKPAQGRAPATVSAEAAPAAPAPLPSSSAKGESASNKMRPGYAAGGAPSSAFRAAGQSVLEVRSAEAVIASPDPTVQWRVGVGGTIERTADGGKTWRGQFVNGGPGLVAGSAPSAKVCWVVGRAGAILRTTDGQNWVRIAPPAMMDFIGIKAKDEKTASVIAADGRSFSTQDGGKTWQVVQQDR